MNRTWGVIVLAAVVLLGGSGCERFKNFWTNDSSTGPVDRYNTTPLANKDKNKRAKSSEAGRRDPVSDMFQIKRRSSDAPILPDSDLNDRERELVNAALKQQERDMDAAAQKRKKNPGKVSREKWVYGIDGFGKQE